MVKLEISNLQSRVRFSYPAPLPGSLAQLVERLPYTQNVGSSSLSRPTKQRNGGREVQCKGLQIPKTAGSNPARCSSGK